jgi:putative ABC transport system permease protein
MKALLRDLRYGWRMLAKAPGFAAVAMLTLALGIGASTAISTVVYGVLFRSLPFPHADRIVQLAELSQGQLGEMDVTAPQLQTLRENSQPFEFLAGYTDVGFNVAAGNAAEHVRGMPVSADYFQVLGVHPALGRDFLPEEDRGNGQRVAIISHDLWSRRFAGDPGMPGRKILLNGDPYTVIGVMPQGFDPRVSADFNTGMAADVWVPLALVSKTVGTGENIGVIARLKPTVTPPQLQSQMSLVTQKFRKDYPHDLSAQGSMDFLPYQFMIGGEVRPYLLVLFGAIGFVLLIACANVANLLLARGSSRGREIALRLSLGATRARLVQQLLCESLWIALGGGALGLFVANGGLRALLAIAPVGLPRVGDIHLDGGILAFALLLSLLTGLLFGLAPAIYVTNASLAEALKEGAVKASSGKGRARFRQGLVVGEFALALVLLTGSGLMITTFVKLMNTSPGFDSHHVLTLQFWLTGSKYTTTAEVTNYYRTVVQRIEALPGVEAAGIVAAGLPLERGGNNGVRIAGPQESKYVFSNYREVSPGYFRAVGIPLQEGRGILESDAGGSSQVVVINQAFAKAYFAGRSPLGGHVYVDQVPREVIGVVRDVKSYLDRQAPPATFVPAAQVAYDTSRMFEGWFPRSIAVRTSLDPLRLSRSVREAVAAVDPLVPVGRILSMDQLASRSVALRSFMMLLLSGFGGVALLLASVGIYGVVSYSVSQRTREIGVRMSLGARPSDVSRMILQYGLRLAMAGAVLGGGAALALTRLLQGLLYGVSMRDPLIFLSVTVLLLGVSLAACYIPACRAMRIDPIVALRYE